MKHLDTEELRHSVCVESCLVVLSARRLAEAIWDEAHGRADPGRVGGNAGVYMQRVLAADSLRSIDKKLCAEMAGLTFNSHLCGAVR